MTKEPKTTTEAELKSLRAGLMDLQTQVTHMQRLGGFTDAKTLSMRAKRTEDRLDQIEADTEMLKDVAAHNSAMMEDHLKDRHGVDLDRDSAVDASRWRSIRRRMREWAEAKGLMKKRGDLSSARRGENRFKPPEQQRVPA